MDAPCDLYGRHRRARSTSSSSAEGSSIEPHRPQVGGLSLVSAVPPPATKDPPHGGTRRRLQPRADAVAPRVTPWDRIIVHPDGRAEVEFHGGVATALSGVEIQQDDLSVVVTLQVGTDPQVG